MKLWYPFEYSTDFIICFIKVKIDQLDKVWIYKTPIQQ